RFILDVCISQELNTLARLKLLDLKKKKYFKGLIKINREKEVVLKKLQLSLESKMRRHPFDEGEEDIYDTARASIAYYIYYLEAMNKKHQNLSEFSIHNIAFKSNLFVTSLALYGLSLDKEN